MELYHLHAIAVHFPIALLFSALAAEISSLLLKEEKWNWLVPSAEWALWLGSIALWAAVGLGFLAEQTAPQVPQALEMLEEHEELGMMVAGTFTALSLVRFVFRKKWRGLRGWRWSYCGVWTILAGLLALTAFYGGQLVFRFGVGVE